MTGSLLTLAVATAVLVMIPGPNVALIVANTLRHGPRSGVATVLGTTLGVGVQLALVTIGLTAIVAAAAEALSWIRWAGVAYLVYLGIRTWRAPPDDLARVVAAPAMFGRGFLIAVLNPKTLLFNAAFIPQFVGQGQGSIAGFGLVSAVYLAVLLFGDLLWVAFAGSARPLLVRYAKARNRLSGALLVAAAATLGAARASNA